MIYIAHSCQIQTGMVIGLRMNEIKQDWMTMNIITVHVLEQTIFAVHEWEHTQLPYAYLQD